MSISKKLLFEDYDNFSTEEDYTTSAEARDYFRNMDEMVTALIDIGLWQPSTRYAKGAVVKSPSMPSGTEAICVAENGGTSSSVEPSWGSVGGENINDGTCFWQLRYTGTVVSVNGAKPDKEGNVSVPIMQGATSTANGVEGLVPAPSAGDENKALCGDGSYKQIDTTPIGTIFAFGANEHPIGYLACDGTAVSRMVYADLFAVIGTTYGSGDGSTTFNLPNLNNNSFLEGSNTAGIVKSAGLPNITGTKSWAGVTTSINSYSGALKSILNTSGYTWNGNSQYHAYDLQFNASHSSSIYGNSTTVQPKAVTVKFCIKAYGAITNAGSVELEDAMKAFEDLKSELDKEAGFIKLCAGDVVPSGYLPCNGSKLSRSTYARLFSIIGTTYGSGDGSTTFNLPNLNNNSFLEGSNTAGIVKSAGLPNITGLASHGQGSTLNVSGAFTSNANNSSIWTPANSTSSTTAKRLGFNASKSNSIYGASTTVQPKSVTVQFLIKY